MQILDANSVQWFAKSDQVEVSGTSFSSAGDAYFNNQSDAEIEASFEIQCP